MRNRASRPKPKARSQISQSRTQNPKSKIRSAYVLLVWNPVRRRIPVGKLGIMEFAPGWYLYVGSGGANAVRRVQRHLAGNKPVRWHIDYLTTGRMQPVDACLYPRVAECRLARELGRKLAGVPGFGCSDCRCRSHLFYSPALPRLTAGRR